MFIITHKISLWPEPILHYLFLFWPPSLHCSSQGVVQGEIKLTMHVLHGPLKPKEVSSQAEFCVGVFLDDKDGEVYSRELWAMGVVGCLCMRVSS